MAFIHGTRVATPNDPKLSDGGAWRGSCEGGAQKEAPDVGQRWLGGKTPKPESAATVTRGAVRCSAWLGVAVGIANGDEARTSLAIVVRGNVAPRILSEMEAKIVGKPTLVKCLEGKLALLGPVRPRCAEAGGTMRKVERKKLLSVKLEDDKKLGVWLRNAWKAVTAPRLVANGN